jgi:hypothetical protein
MAKLIYQAKDRTPVDQNGSLYLLLEEPIRKVLGLDNNTEMAIEVYWSEKHKDHYIAVYKKPVVAGDAVVEAQPTTESTQKPE